MFSAKTSGPSTGGLFGGSLFGSGNAQNTSTPSPATTSAPGNAGGGGLFSNLGNSSAQPKPSGGLFGNTGGGNTQPAGTNMFGSSLGGQQQGTATSSGGGGGGGLFGSSTATSSQPQSSGLFSGLGGAGNKTTTQSGPTGGGLFSGLGGGASTTQPQPQPKPMLGGLGTSTSTTGGGLFGNQNTTQSQQPQQQPQQPQKPTLSLFGDKAAGAQQTQQQTAAGSTVIPGVKVDTSNLLPTTKYESCVDEIKKEIETVDNYILNQIKMCNEVADLLPTIDSQGATIPNDVEFVQGKLETMQHALENDATDIDQVRGLVSRDAAEAQVAFRAIDTLRLPLQYQSTGGVGWMNLQDSKLADRRSMRSTRKNTLALPDDVESDPSTAESINGVPVNLIDYFSQRSDEMSTVLERYKRNLKEIEGHISGVEHTLNQQVYEFMASRSPDGAVGTTAAPKSVVGDLSVVLRDVESGIMGVADRLSDTKDQAQEVILGPPSLGANRLNI